MKKSIMFSILIVPILLFGQLDIGIKAGLHSYDLPTSNSNGANIKNANYGLHVGLVSKINLGGLFLEPSLLLNNVSAKYSVTESGDEIEEGNLNIDLPVMLGLNIAILDVFAGPVAHLRFSGYDDLIRLGQYDENISSAFFGGQLGVGIKLSKIGFDLRYEKNFKEKDLGILGTIDELKLVDANSRIMLSAAYYF